MALVQEGIGLYQLNVVDASNTTPIVITTSGAHGYATGERVKIAGVGGNTNANGTWASITVTNVDTFILDGSTYGGVPYTSGGTSGREYATIFAWESAHSGALGGNVYEGLLYDDRDPGDGKRKGFTILAAGAQLTIAGATGQGVSAYRHLRAAPGHEYDPTTETGARIYHEASTVAANGTGLAVDEDRFRASNIGVIQIGFTTNEFPTANVHACVSVTASRANCVFDGVYAKFAVGTGGTKYGFWVATSITAQSHQFRNCVAEGSPVSGLGMTHGFSPGHTALVHNCGAVRAGVGFTNADATPTHMTVRNSWAVDCENGDFAAGVTADADMDYCVSSDGSAAGANSVTFASTETMFNGPTWSDFRPRQNSVLVDGGEDLSATFTTDLTGGTRATTSEWEIGPYDGYVLPASAGAVNVVESLIGPGEDYDTFAEWLADTDVHLPGLNTQHVGLLTVQASLGASDVVVLGYPADSRRNRVLKAAPGFRYDPRTGTGAKLSGTANNVLLLQQDYFQIEGVAVVQTDASAASGKCAVTIESNKGVRLEGAYVAHEEGSTNTNRRCVWVKYGDAHRIFNSIVRGGTATAGSHRGVEIDDGVTNTHVYHCSIHRHRNGTGANGVLVNGSSANGNRVWNCAIALCDVTIVAPAGVQAFNSTTDTGAVGQGALVNVSAGAMFQDGVGNDYRVPMGSPNVDSAFNLGSTVEFDFTGAKRTFPGERGAYDGFVYAETAKVVSRETHYRSRCWTVVRTFDGQTWFFTDHSSPLPFRGNNYTPVGGFDRSNSETLIGLEGADVEFFGPIVDEIFTLESLLAQQWDEAVITEYVVNNRHPYMAPYDVSVWIADRFEFDGVRWKGVLSGVAGRLASIPQGHHTRNCPFRVYSNDPTKHQLCGLDVNAFATDNVDVDTVVDSRLSFTVVSGTGAGELPAQTNGYYDLGPVIWLRGDNVGRESEVKTYTTAGGVGTIVLQEKTKFPIQASDVALIAPGCDGRFVTCDTVFGNVRRFGGDRDVPGTDETITTPKE